MYLYQLDNKAKLIKFEDLVKVNMLIDVGKMIREPEIKLIKEPVDMVVAFLDLLRYALVKFLVLTLCFDLRIFLQLDSLLLFNH
jgi:hypothetical protein